MVWRAKIMKHYQNATRTLLTRDAFASNCCRPISHRKFLRHVQSFNEIAIKVLNGFYIASRCSSARSTQIDISYSFFPESLFGVWWADVFRRMEMCNCTRCNQQKKVKISIFIPGFGNGLFLYFLHTVNESCAIFFLSFSTLFLYACSIHQAACVQLKESSGNVQLHIERTTWFFSIISAPFEGSLEHRLWVLHIIILRSNYSKLLMMLDKFASVNEESHQTLSFPLPPCFIIISFLYKSSNNPNAFFSHKFSFLFRSSSKNGADAT